MNFLAHAYLSHGNADILTGNMISDFVKGKKQFDYPEMIQTGIQLHRATDRFTDDHEVTQTFKKFYKADYRLYAGAFVDVTYDYFLANDTAYFNSEDALLSFSQTVYRQLESNTHLLPSSFADMLPYMAKQNWLYNYRALTGMQKSFEGLRRRSKYITETETAFSIFCNNLPEMEALYRQFFPQLQAFTLITLNNMVQKS